MPSKKVCTFALLYKHWSRMPNLHSIYIYQNFMRQTTILLADSGSTKTDWVIASDDGQLYSRFNTSGLNPCVLDDNSILDILSGELLPQLPPAMIGEVRFCGAGCRGEAATRMSDCLKRLLPESVVTVESDLLGAARILCRDKAGIVSILGTGSASCLYDGRQIVSQVPSLGYILGDEGSGAVLGRQLVGYIYKHGADETLVAAFRQKYGLTVDQLIESVYRKPAPNRFLAAFTYFINEYIDHPDMQDIVMSELHRFFRKNICHYPSCAAERHVPLYFVGSIAWVFQKQLSSVASHYGFRIARVLRHPLDEICGKMLNE